MPRISVIMSVYNAERYVRQAIDSILGQTYGDFEFIIIDDGSSDASPGIITSYHDERIRVVSQDNIGLTRSLNKGIKMARGRYIARQDADDVSEPDRFEKQVLALDNNGSAGLVSTNIRYFSEAWSQATESNRSVHPALAKWLLLFYNHVGGHSQVMFRRETAEKLNGYDENIRYSQDYDFWLRISEVADIVILPEVLLNFRHHDSNLSKTAAEEQLRQSLSNSANAIERRSGVRLDLDDIKIFRKFWLKSGGEISAAEAAELDAKFKMLLNGARRRESISPDDSAQISALISRFYHFSADACTSSTAREVLESLAGSWRETGRGKNEEMTQGLSSKFV